MAWNRNMAASYKQEMKKLSGRTADLAFIPVDPRQEQWFYLRCRFYGAGGRKMDFPDAFLGRLYDYTKINRTSIQ